MDKRRRPVAAILLPLIVGLVGLSSLMNKPRFAQVQTVDVVQLLGSGVCFGVTFAVLAFWLRDRSAQ